MNSQKYTINNQVLTINGDITHIRPFDFYKFKIKKVNIHSNIIYIGGSAFENNKIEHIKLPNNINCVENTAFYNNPLKTITFKGVTYNIKMIDKYPFVIESSIIKNNRIIYKGNWLYGIYNNKLSLSTLGVKKLSNYTQ